MRVLLSPDGTRGDVHPLLALGEVCRDAGHQVLLCAGPNFEHAARARGFGFHSNGIDVESELARHAGGVVGGSLALLRAERALLRRYFAEA
ncbi:MAG: glycosyltransferase, partial [Myxococcota bacterium]|nr:glycosyltransferase [Myxococcota bacterium]